MSEGRTADDPRIANEEVLLRRLSPLWIVKGNHGQMRISSAAFKHEEMSVLLLSLLEEQGRNEADALTDYPRDSLCSVTAGLARELGQDVIYDTDPPHDPAHGLVIGRKRQSVASRFAREAKWVIPSEPPAIPD